ncbi:CCA tRNA nucleotidyltransferase [Roseospirillum parvum]|uniref:Poly(A) polymerase n=1 Tax=Roseospirillum parvum TaxID=83401 RepID=A0A1G7ZSI5_9PROT|nr:CCA tRNA nucleotidyltransferase [Roseospirillum parvum]SDH11080.1 poly(A) polymerase [Roseospirillum parvum]
MARRPTPPAPVVRVGDGHGPVGQLAPQPWTTDAATRRLLAALRAGGRPVRFVGGCVRDGLLNRPVADIDLATPEPPERVMALLEKAGLKAVPTGLQHGTVTHPAPPLTFEITTLRRDVACDGRHAVVAYTEDWRADAARRDFTINALSADPSSGAVWDYFNGLDDLAQGRVRFVGRATRRIEEDHLRILRFFRFFARYGRPPADRDALAACTARRAGLAALSGERVRAEMLKIIGGPEATDTLLLMRGHRVLAEVLPEAAHFDRLRQVTFLVERGVVRDGLKADPLRRLACLIGPDPKAARAIATRWRLSGAEAARLLTLCGPLEEAEPSLGPPALRALAERLGTATAADRLLLAWAAQRAASGRTDAALSQRWRAALDGVLDWTVPDFPLKGQDLLDLGMAPGPGVGMLLGELKALWRAEDYAPDYQDLLAEARRRLDPDQP